MKKFNFFFFVYLNIIKNNYNKRYIMHRELQHVFLISWPPNNKNKFNNKSLQQYFSVSNYC